MRKVISLISFFSLLLNIVHAPAYVLAQELTENQASEEVVLESTQEQEESLPQENTVEEGADIDMELSEEVADEELIADEPEEAVENEEGNVIEDEIESPVLSVTASETIVEEENTQSYDFDLTYNESSSASLATDKDDYAPSDLVTISGSGFLHDTTYLLVVSSEDDPAVRHETNVTADSEGNLVYYYQLDGIYRPNYLVEVYLGNQLVSKIVFTDSHVSTHLCQVDVAGANDEPGQKDLTQMCADYSGLDTYIEIDWNWDDTEWPGANTGDACALFDNDGDGLADYAVCVTVGGKPASQISGSPRLYSCNNTRADRCAGSTLISGPYGTACSVNQTADDPFPDGAYYPYDTKASCVIQLEEVGGESDTVLTDVCSFPSQQPNSDPSDCIIARTKAARLEVIKDLIPNTDNGLFNLLIDGQIFKYDASDGGTTGEVSIDVGNNGKTVTISESAGTNTLLSTYTTSIECRDLNGTGSIIASSTTTSVNVFLNDQDDVVCRITNELQKGTLTVNKTIDPIDDGGKFNLLIGATTYASDIGHNGSTGAIELQAGSYIVSETAGTGTNLNDYDSVIGGDCDFQGNVTLAAGENKTCTITNTLKRGTIIVEKQTVPDGVLETFTFTGDALGSISDGEQITVGSLLPGQYTATESDPTPAFDLTDIDCDDDNSIWDLQTRTATFNVEPGETVKCTFTNTQRGSISGYKFDADGQTGLEGWKIDLYSCMIGQDAADCLLSGPVSSTTTDSSGFYSFTYLISGYYIVSEELQNGWTNISPLTQEVDLDPGETADDVNFINFKLGKITVCKYYDLTGNGQYEPGDDYPLSGISIKLSQETTLLDTKETGQDGCVEFESLTAGSYKIEEDYTDPDLDGYYSTNAITSYDVNISSGSDETRIFLNTLYRSISGYKFNDLNGNGIWDMGEPALEGWTVFIDEDFDGIFDASEPSTTTDSFGYFEFTGLLADLYRIAEVQQSGWVQTYPATSYHDVDIHTLVSSEENNFGNRGLGGITIRKIVDPVDDSTWDFDVVDPYGNFAGDVNTTLSHGSSASWSNLPAGVYTISEYSSPDYEVSFDCGNFGAGNDNSVTFDLNAGDDVDCTFTNAAKPGKISGHKYEDLVGDGTKSNPLENWTVFIDEDDDMELGVGEDLTTTDSFGYYEFAGLVSGETYKICEVVKVGWYQTSPGFYTTPQCFEVTMTPNGNFEKMDFTNSIFASLGDEIWEDLNADGIQDPGEPVFGGISVNLYKDDGDGIFEPGTDDEFVGTEVSDNTTGEYIFENLIAGDYWVQLDMSTVPSGYVPTTLGLFLVTLLPGENYLDADFGLVSPVNEILLLKENDRPNANVGDTVSYKLTLENNGQTAIEGIAIWDALPAGFIYESGSSKLNDTTFVDPTISGGFLSWDIPVSLSPGESLVLEYRVEIGDVSDSLYTNIAVAKGYAGCVLTLSHLRDECFSTEEVVETNVATSVVLIGTFVSPSGDVLPQVLGISTVLPATGSETVILIFFSLMLTVGVLFKLYAKGMKKSYEKNN
jgi:uncharacterized repeat protein (TIGR01451 family)